MELFLSHSSMDKSNVKNIVAYLPKQIQTWLDEKNLLCGSNLSETFEKVIKTETDYVLVFLSGSREMNTWVLKELNWALEHQKKIGRIFVIPVIMPNVCGDPFDIFPEIKDLKYLRLDNYEDSGFKSCAEKIFNTLIGLILQDLEDTKHPKYINNTINNAKNVMDDLCSKIYSIVFKHRVNNPISTHDLYNQLKSSMPVSYDMDQFYDLLNYATQKLSGIYYDGMQLYLIEEHSVWKAKTGIQKKEDIAYLASKYIRNGQTIYIDAGSTLEELVKIICFRAKTHTLHGLTIITPSTDLVSKIANACSDLGCDEFNAPIKLLVPGGMVRINTKAIVNLNSNADNLQNLIDYAGHIDVAFIGANGITEEGVATHDNLELFNKRIVLKNATQVFFAADDSKCGLTCESILKTFDENDFKIIVNRNDANDDLQKLLKMFPDSFLVADKKPQ